MKRLLALLTLLVLIPTAANAWWDTAWSGRKKIVLNTKVAGVVAEVGNMPVLVRLSTGSFDFVGSKDDGSDLRFVAEDDKTVLNYAIERYDPVNELAFIWVQVPKLAADSSSQHIWLYSANPKAPAPARTASPFDASHVAVLHLNESQGLPLDASANALPVTQANPAYETGGLVGGAGRLNASNPLVIPVPALAGAKAYSISFWVKPQKGTAELLSMGPNSLSLKDGVLVLQSAGGQAKTTTALAEDSWHLVTLTVGQTSTLYANGKPEASLPVALPVPSSLSFGAGLVGLLDEVRITATALTPAHVAAQMESESQGGKLVQPGEDQTTDSSEGPSYFVTTMKNVTVDGWVVVIICALMFVVAILVMISKTLSLGKRQKSNQSFSDAFDQLTLALADSDKTAHAQADKLQQLVRAEGDHQHSPMYRIFKVGARELIARFPHRDNTGGKPAISTRAIEAVRASLTTQMTRETQQMNQGMVLLTIAISGGPFLGLLGTVVGVMITFAAIAAAGDVNVNAIAPGIAAALVATVAGLAVAIPSLFGYNYLMTRIKEMSVDMHVFVDEFVAKMAENYGD
jgi:biopolymer transport protein ExbB